MFIDVTRFGGLRVMRVAIAAIAYLDAVEGGCAVHLIGGETLRVNEDPAEIEARCAPPELILDAAHLNTMTAALTSEPGATGLVVEPSEVDRYPAKRGSRGRAGR